MLFSYKVFNLMIESEIEILHLPRVSQDIKNMKEPDVKIRLGIVPQMGADESWGQSNYFFSKDEDLCLQFVDVGRFLIQQGNLITVEPFEKSFDLGTLSTFLMGSACLPRYEALAKCRRLFSN